MRGESDRRLTVGPVLYSVDDLMSVVFAAKARASARPSRCPDVPAWAVNGRVAIYATTTAAMISGATPPPRL